MNEFKDLRLTVASSPHVNSPVDTRQLMLDVLIALVPAMVMGVYFFGPRALVLTLVSVVGCEVFEFGYRKLMKKPGALGDLSAAVTGVLLAFVWPVSIPYWTILVGDFFAGVVVTQPPPWERFTPEIFPRRITMDLWICWWVMWAAVSVRFPPSLCFWAAYT